MNEKTKFAVTGALAGAANGFFGAGGGLFLVPLLAGWCGMEQRKAFATSVAVVLPLSMVSAVIYWMKGGLDFGAAWPYLLGGALGGMIAGRVFRKVDMVWLRRAFGLLILYGGVRAVLLLWRCSFPCWPALRPAFYPASASAAARCCCST